RSPKCFREEFLPPPVALVDFFNLFLAQAEVVAQLVNQRLANTDNQVVFALAGVLDGALVESDAIGQRVSVGPAAFGERRALVQPEQRVGRLDLHLFEQRVGRLVLDDDREVRDGPPELRRDARDGVLDAGLELLPRHERAFRPAAALRAGFEGVPAGFGADGFTDFEREDAGTADGPSAR